MGGGPVQLAHRVITALSSGLPEQQHSHEEHAMTTKFAHQVESGELQVRSSKTKSYTHVVVGWGLCYGDTEPHWHVLRWSESEANAAKSVGAREFGGYTQQHVEAINGGER